MNKKIWIALAVLVVLAVGAWVLTSANSDNSNKEEGTTQTQPSSSSDSSDNSSQNNSGQNPSSSANAVDISGFAFSPSNITVKVGGTVTWTNMDSSAHTVTGITSNGPDSGTLQKGQTYSFKFTEAGTYKYSCKFHPSMTGTVTVQ